MRTIYFFIAALALLFAGCKKSTGSGTVSSNYYITCNLNGAAQNYTLAQTCNFSSTINAGQTNYIFLLQGFTAGTRGIQITILDYSAPIPVAAGTYVDTSTTYTLTCSDATAGNINFWSAGSPDSVANPFTFVITSISGSTISGTFQGNLYDTNTGATVETVTNGKFNLPFKKN